MGGLSLLDDRLTEIVGICKDDLLVVQDCVREFFLEDLLLKELLDSHAQKWLSQNLIDTGSSPGIDREHLIDQVAELLAKV